MAAKTEDKTKKKPAPEAGEKPAEAAAEPAPKGKKKGLILGGGLAATIALGFVAAQLAVPSETSIARFDGPFVALLSEAPLTVNLGGGGATRFLAWHMNAMFDAYDETYQQTRVADPLFQAMLTDTLLQLASRKTAAELLDPTNAEVFLEEVRVAIDPLLFPVHIGEAPSPTAQDPESGLRGGLSIFKSTLRGALFEHQLVVDALAKTLALDGGEPVAFQGSEQDLSVAGANGDVVYVDVTGIKKGFQHTLDVGTQGRVRSILKQSFIVQ